MAQAKKTSPGGVPALPLPSPEALSTMPLEGVLRARRSVRDYAGEPLTLTQLARLLWAGQGVTSADGLRTAPSAGALYPLELYVAVSRVAALARGVYRYVPNAHALVRVLDREVHQALTAAAFDQEAIAQAALVLAFVALPARTERRYGERAWRYIHIEVGHAAQNVWLQAVALGLVAVVIGAFDDAMVQRLLGLPDGVVPLYLMPIGIHRTLA